MKSKKILLIAIITIIAIGNYLLLFDKKNNDQTTFFENKAKIGDIEIKVFATGTVQPENRLEIKPPIAGRVEQVIIKEGQVVKKGQILAWMSSSERAALLDAARSGGEKELKKWQEIYPPTPVVAPLDGTIVLKNVEQGQTFTNSDVLMTMSDHLIVKAQVDETDIASIKPDQTAQIILDAYPDHKIPAKVERIAFDATTVNNVTTYVVFVIPENVPSFMRSGMTANVTFVIAQKKNILLVPSAALKPVKGSYFVLSRNGKKQFEKEVEIGVSDGKYTEILSGLSEGDVVLSDQIQIQNGNGSGSNPFSPTRNRARTR